jgi:hypothetical protein
VPLGQNQVLIFDCGGPISECAFCGRAQIVPTNTCPDLLIGMGMKAADGTFQIPVNPPLVPGHAIYATDLCNDPPFDVSQAVLVPSLTTPLLSPLMVVVLMAALGLVGLSGMLRRLPER